jgi:hypothetical protein
MHNGRLVEMVSDDHSVMSSDGFLTGLDIERFIELSIQDGCSLRIDLPLQQKVILISSGNVDIRPLTASPFVVDGARRVISLWGALEV